MFEWLHKHKYSKSNIFKISHLIHDRIILPWMPVLQKIAKSDTTLWQWLDTIHYLFQDEYKWIFHVVNFFYETINFRNHQLLSILGRWLVFCVANCSQNVTNYSISCWPLNGPTLWPNFLSLIAKLKLIW